MLEVKEFEEVIEVIASLEVIGVNEVNDDTLVR